MIPKMEEKQNKKKKYIIKPSRIIFLIVLIASNTFAWFIYATKIDTNVSVHVRAWNVIFEAGENEVTDVIDLPVDSIYPGMPDYTYEINAYNRGDVAASLSYQVLEARILDQEYISVEGRQARGQTAVATDMTSEQLKNKLSTDYPFKISIGISGSVLQVGTGVETYTFNVIWPYENNHDDIDTEWGINAYNFKEENPNTPTISLKVKIIITQTPN